VLGTASFGDAQGTVTQFDAASGLGEVTGDDSTVYPFHCTAIADGSRAIEVGAAVAFTIAAGHLGRLEATAITK
jgi:cold shock CspA family protein